MKLKSNEIFDELCKVVNLYVAILAIITLLAAVGFFKIKSEPVVRVLKPIYFLDMNGIVRAAKKGGVVDSIPKEWNQFTNKLMTYGHNVGLHMFGIKIGQGLAPYEDNFGTNFTFGLPVYTHPQDMLVDLGLIDKPSTNHLNKTILSDDQKRLRLQGLLGLDLQAVAWKQHLEPGWNMDRNPLQIFVTLTNIVYGSFDEATASFVNELRDSVYVVSIISVENPTSEAMENVRIAVSDSVYGTGTELVGWSVLPQVTDNTSRSRLLRLNVEHINAGESIEVVFRGKRFIRPEEVMVSLAPLSIQKSKVALIMLSTLCVTILLWWITLKRLT